MIRALRAALAAASVLAGCGAPVVTGAHRDAARLADTLRALPEPTTARWDSRVRTLLTNHYDADGSGALDAPTEIVALDCDVVRTLDARVRQATTAGLDVVYGLTGSSRWTGQLLGLSEAVAAEVASRLAACGPSASPRNADDPVAQAIVALDEVGGTDDWDERIRPLLLAAYDRDGNGAIDTSVEIEGVGCAAWSALDQAVQLGSGAPLLALYGFTEGYGWVGDALGLAREARQAAFRAATDCDIPPE
ncbi:MAG: hypothetical protein CSA66_03805 [Proteobacteria bacterium]|nr:MAG: hypothetical protein CSA66_03805 [Pseudomonadota bacterium]